MGPGTTGEARPRSMTSQFLFKVERTVKTCFKCLREQDLSQFYKHPRMQDGHLNKCKDCARLDASTNYKHKRQQYSEYDKMRERRPERKQQKRSALKTHRAKHPERNRARSRVASALRSGLLHRLPCKLCGSEKSQAHHEDYLKPLDVEWLCFVCHREHRHKQIVTQSPTESVISAE